MEIREAGFRLNPVQSTDIGRSGIYIMATPNRKILLVRLFFGTGHLLAAVVPHNLSM